MKLICLSLLAVLILSTSYSYSQGPPAKDTVSISSLPANDSIVIKTTDTSKVTKISVQDIQAPSSSTLFGFKIPNWLVSLMTILLSVLPTIQIILKRIPSDTTLKIGGILGKFLDLLTFFQKDVITKPPANAAKT